MHAVKVIYRNQMKGAKDLLCFAIVENKHQHFSVFVSVNKAYYEVHNQSLKLENRSDFC